jgi:hypothetical protein
MISTKQLSEVIGAEVVDDAGATIGTVGAVYLDGDGTPAWATVRSEVLGHTDAFVPLEDSRLDRGALVLTVSIDQVKRAPRPRTHAHPSTEETDLLRQHYGLQPGEGGPAVLSPDGDEPHGTVTGAAYDRPREAHPPSRVEDVSNRTGAGADSGVRRLLRRYRPRPGQRAGREDVDPTGR